MSSWALRYEILSAAHPELEGVVVRARQVPGDELEGIHRAEAGELRRLAFCGWRSSTKCHGTIGSNALVLIRIHKPITQLRANHWR
jgi:hypothetical protein